MLIHQKKYTVGIDVHSTGEMIVGNDEQKTPSLIGVGPLQITGGGVTILQKEFLQGKLI